MCPALPPTFAQMLKSGATWHLAFLGLYWYYVMIGLLNTLVSFLHQGAGLPLTLSSLYFSLACALSMAGNVLCGWALDTYAQAAVIFLSALLCTIGTLLPFEFPLRTLSDNSVQLLVFSVVYGLGWGASFSVLASMPAKIFGGAPDFAKLQGFLALFQMGGGALGTMVTGELSGSTGSFDTAFHLFTIASAVACVHALALSMRSRMGAKL
jgi:MFS family permease